MKRVLITLTSILFITGCTSTKRINDIDQTFFDYVIVNSNHNYQTNANKIQEFKEVGPESFPGLRLIKWYQTK